MPEPLKNVYGEPFLREFGDKVSSAWSGFEAARFVEEVMNGDWEQLELKQRMRKISVTLGRHLPASYPEALEMLYIIESECSGFPYLFFPDFVEVHGQGEEHWQLSMEALERFTVRSSAEFAVRPFLLREPDKMLRQMMTWASHPNEHVRRLASEGSRPRLPWGQALPMFKKDPAPLLPLLELLKADPSLYVRNSVANHLNDIAKDHPELVIHTAKSWIGSHPDTDWIVRHGCRTLIRKADPQVLEIFGYAQEDEQPLAERAAIEAVPGTAEIGGSNELRYELRIRSGEPVRLRIEYGIDFVKARGQTSRKLFLLSDKTVAGGSLISGSRMHSWKDLTTRKHYPGEHRISLLVNGKETACTIVDVHREQ